MKSVWIGLLVSAVSTVTSAQPNPQYGGVDYTLRTALVRFPERVQVTYMLDEAIKDQTVEVGCQNGTEDPRWIPLKAGEGSNCDRQSNQNLRIFVRLKLCAVETTIEMKPKNVESSWKKEGLHEGSILLFLREKSLNWRNVFVKRRPFSVLKSC